ncbi:AAA family ATPase [Bacillus sp. J14TS2]|uniref:AAA family ATPase n=1 Tax=Bacillus sp. J14TS2 TaxID=2807188 RepID=UPI001B01A2A8|nr:AAA family ATPase [Bacillus sp. J14TS2]GIN71173.1 AAA family ATPase [Bacillus sp. J14TS2]
MKTIKLLNLSLENFKGVRRFSIDIQGENVKVYGENGTGKTTIYDAFLWLLFNRDSLNSTKFAIKTLDEGGNEASGLEHSVEATFSIDDTSLTLKKIHKEVWTKKRNAAQATFSGHTNDYFIDGVPASQGEYNKLITDLIDEDIFKLLTNPSYFNEILKADQRRKVLLEVSGDITDEDIIARNPRLSALPDILGNRTIEKHKKFIAEKRKGINQELDRIPIRINEIEHNLPSLEGLDKPAIVAEISRIDSQIDGEQDLISNIRNGNTIVQKQKEVQEIEFQLMQLKQEHEAGSKDAIYKLQARIQEEKSNVTIINRELDSLKDHKRFNDESIQRIESELVQLRQEYAEINSLEFSHSDACECPTCGQDLPEEQVAAAREKALKQFNIDKSERLEGINLKGRQGKDKKDAYIQENEALTKSYEKTSKQITEKQNLLEKLNGQLSQAQDAVVDVTENKQYVSILEEKQELQNEISSLKELANESIQEIQVAIAQLKTEREQYQGDLNKFMIVEQSEKRINELRDQEQDLAREFEQLEEQLFLIEEFTRTKVEVLEEKINSKFKYARFKLFETQVNGALNDICVTTYKGVPYDKGLNNAAKINIGLDIINTLSEHYGFSAPIFVDNAEAVTKLIDTDSQLISLIVSKLADKLFIGDYEDLLAYAKEKRLKEAI